MKKFFAEFKKFIQRGNVIDLAVGVIIGGAFSKITSSMVNDIIVRRIKGIPTLTLTVDAQDATAGLETRLESFIDILHFRKGEGLF